MMYLADAGICFLLLCRMETYVRLVWLVRFSYLTKFSFIFVQVILQGGYHPFHVTRTGNYTRCYRADGGCYHHEIHDKFFPGVCNKHIV